MSNNSILLFKVVIFTECKYLNTVNTAYTVPALYEKPYNVHMYEYPDSQQYLIHGDATFYYETLL